MNNKKQGDRMIELSDNLDDMEIQLQSSLSPVKPNPEFVQQLRRRLTSPPTMVLEMRSHLFDLFVALSIVMGGILILVMILRGIYELLVLIGLIRSEE